MTLVPILFWPSAEASKRLEVRPFEENNLWNRVESIVKDTRARGNEALLEYTARFDGCTLTEAELRVSETEITEAYASVDEEYLAALRQAKENIRKFHELQKRNNWFKQEEDGSLVGQIYRPMERVGIYVPGGTANYPSSVLMTALPAVVAGVPEIVMVTPPGKDGKLPPATLVAAKEAGVTEIYRLGGAQAIAALAYGTATIRGVDKIVGPGNSYVTLAKKMVYGTVGIDMLAGPSEILIIGDGTVNPTYAAADLLSQAEHDIQARAVLVTPNEDWGRQVARELEKQVELLPRREIAQKALQECGAIIVVKDLSEAYQVANMVAPEHLEILLQDPLAALGSIKHAGAVFLGPYSPEPIGDYWAGPNHVLPTSGTARYNSPLTVDDYCKRSSVISYTRQGLLQAAGAIQTLTKWENLEAHGRAIAVRIEEAGK